MNRRITSFPTLRPALAVAAIAAACALPVAAQTTGTTSSNTGSTAATTASTATTDPRRTDDRRDWGWIDLLGLAGLLGLRRRTDNPIDRQSPSTTTAASR